MIIWKEYISCIGDTFTTYPFKYPSILGPYTYCFKQTKVFFDQVSFCPSIFYNDFPEFFKQYRITALNLIASQAECVINNDGEFKVDHTYKKGDIKLVYWPNNPKLEEPRIEKTSKYWVVKAKEIHVCAHFEILPLYPRITIPSVSHYRDVEAFDKFYAGIANKDPFNSNYMIENDILPSMESLSEEDAQNLTADADPEVFITTLEKVALL